MRPWLFRIAHNEAVGVLRRRTTTCALDEQFGDAAAVEDRVFEREALRVLQADLAGLTEGQRGSMVLCELNGLGHDEIADVLGTSPAAARQAVFEARSVLLSCREGRDTARADIRRTLSDGDGRVLRGRRVQAHLLSCGGCRAFRDDLACPRPGWGESGDRTDPDLHLHERIARDGAHLAIWADVIPPCKTARGPRPRLARSGPTPALVPLVSEIPSALAADTRHELPSDRPRSADAW